MQLQNYNKKRGQRLGDGKISSILSCLKPKNLLTIAALLTISSNNFDGFNTKVQAVNLHLHEQQYEALDESLQSDLEQELLNDHERGKIIRLAQARNSDLRPSDYDPELNNIDIEEPVLVK